MGEDCGSWIPQQNFHWQSPKLNSSSDLLDMGLHNAMSAFMNSGANLAPTNRTLPVYAFPEVPHTRVGQVNEAHGWFYCLPRFRQALRPASNSLHKEKLPATPYENCKEAITSNMGPGCAQKSFIVFDQSRDQTTLIFSSGIGAPPVQCSNPWTPKPPATCNLTAEHHGITRDLNHHNSGPILTDEFCENYKTDVQSEMHEDTEELNALLYSDDDSDSTEDDDDDEVTSTAHSPSTMTAHDKPDWFNGRTEEVASSAGPTRKRKLFDDVPSLVDTASSAKPKKSFEYEDDAESSCGNGKNQSFKSDNKRMKREKIRETVSMLQDLIPGGKGRDAIEVLDEAINYLKSLKYKATALGLNSL